MVFRNLGRGGDILGVYRLSWCGCRRVDEYWNGLVFYLGTGLLLGWGWIGLGFWKRARGLRGGFILVALDVRILVYLSFLSKTCVVFSIEIVYNGGTT